MVIRLALFLLARSGKINITDLQTSVDFKGYEIDELYSGTPTLLFNTFHEPVKNTDKANTTYIDIGCGKGRALIQGIEAGFKNVVGVEFVPLIANQGRENIKTAMKMLNKDVNWEIVSQDVREYKFPATNLVLYLFNPFDASIFEVFLNNLLLDLEANPRQATLIYNHSYCAPMLDACELMERVNYSSRSKLALNFLSNHSYGAWRFKYPNVSYDA